MLRGHQLFLIAILFYSSYALGTDRVSTGSGNWSVAGTWSPSGVPASGDNVTILSGHTIAMNSSSGSCNNITINGTFGCNSSTTLNAGGNLVINNSGVINGGTGKLNVVGSFFVPMGDSASVGSVSLNVSGLSTIDGSFFIISTAGTKTFSDIIVNSGGAWISNINEAVTVNGNVIANSTFDCNSGTYTISGNFSSNYGATNFEGTIGGELAVASTATFNVNSGNCTVNGGTTISGTINITTTTGSKNFHDITLNAGGIWNSSVPVAESVTVTGNVITSGSWNCFSGTYTINGNFSVNAGTSYFEGTIEGDLTINSGATIDSPTGILKVIGSTFISGTLTISTVTSSKSFADVTINSGGVWNCSVAESLTISGNLTNNGTFIANTGTYTFSGTGKIISGIISVGKASVTGSYTSTGDLTVETSLTGKGSLTQDTNSVLNIGGTSSITDLIANVNPNAVNYNGSSDQTMKLTSYYDLYVNSTGGIVTFGTISVDNNFTVATGTVSIGGVTMNVSGTTSISGTINITKTTGTKTFNDLIINSGGSWISNVSESFIINGSISNSGIFNANTGTYTLAGVSKTLSGILEIPTISVTGSYVNNATFTSSSKMSGAGAFSQGSTGILNVELTSANFSVATFNASAPGNTVSYNYAGVQNVRMPNDASYHHLILAGSGNKTLLGLTDVNGDLTINSVLVANNFNITVGGDWLDNGTFAPGTNTVTLDGITQSVEKPGGETFNHLVVGGTGVKTLESPISLNGNITINSTLDVSLSNFGVDIKGNWINNGIFIQRGGTATFNGNTAQTIGGTSTTDFNNIITSNSSGVSVTHAQNLIDSLTINAGTFTTTGYDFTLLSDADNTARIAAIPSGANYAGKIIMQRYTGTGPANWRYLSSPVSDATIADWADDFATSGFPGSIDPGNPFVSIYSYDESAFGVEDNGYVPPSNVTDSITCGKGFMAYIGPNPVTFKVTGHPNTFTVTPKVTFTSSAGIDQDGWNLIANPYPSAINWDNPNWTKTNVDNAIYIYNSSTRSYASYVNGLGTDGGSKYIASQQAFWVKANAANPVVKFVENVKAARNPSFLKILPSKNTSNYPMAFKDFSIPHNSNLIPNSIRLVANGNGFDDEALIYFVKDASSHFDKGFDAWKLLGDNPLMPNISSVVNDSTDLSINGLPQLTSDVTISIRMRAPSAGTYSIRRDSVLMLPMSSCVILEDLATKTLTDLRSSISYSFTVSDTTYSTPRFLLHIYAPIFKKAIKTNCAKDSSGIAIAKGTGNGPWNYVWKNSVGNILQTTNNSSQPDTLFNLPVGIYTIEVSGTVCGNVSDTVQIKSSSEMILNTVVSNISCHGFNDGSVSVNPLGGNAPYFYAWNTGGTAYTVESLAAGNYSVVVTDAGGCTQIKALSVTQPPVLIAGFIVSSDTVDLSVNNSVLFTDTSSGALFYRWDFGDITNVDTSQKPLHYYSFSGKYSVVHIVSNGTCFDTSYSHIVVIDSLNTSGIKDLNIGSSVNIVYEKGEVFMMFDLPQRTDIGISIYNAIGGKIITQNTQQIQQGKIRLNMDNLSPGIYFGEIVMKTAGQISGQLSDAIIAKKIIITSR